MVEISQSTFEKHGIDCFFFEVSHLYCIKPPTFIHYRCEISKKKQSMLCFSKVLWDIKTKFLPLLDLYRGQLLTKLQVPKCNHFEFPAKIVKNFWRAWQAYSLRNILRFGEKSYLSKMIKWCEMMILVYQMVSDLAKMGGSDPSTSKRSPWII